MSDKAYRSVWDAISETPTEARNMKRRSALMMAINDLIDAKEMTQAEVGKILGVAQSRVSNLVGGKISLFSLDTLIEFAEKLGLFVRMDIDASQTLEAA
ncbi:helix-turn-helix domain-containing protein [Aureimonas psammosilenae]|uniref:helix-turn-helix domain-containing protein n=1 Tax=Aureimonas psammosilenae TaxID=2495496 RepID=UPI0012609838|nr:XRE family transcriptional regulator [Aureimonas psammosilenae]